MVKRQNEENQNKLDVNEAVNKEEKSCFDMASPNWWHDRISRYNIMKRQEKSLAYFSEGYNCAQSILASFGEDFSCDEATCLRIASSFGAGMARAQEVCGAVTGGLMAIGLALGERCATPNEREAIYENAAAFMDSFKERFGSLLCRDLLGIDLATPEGRDKMAQRGHAACRAYVGGAAEILERMLPRPCSED